MVYLLKKFYYNRCKRFEPIYYNGSSSILDLNAQLKYTDEQILEQITPKILTLWFTQKKSKIKFFKFYLNSTYKKKLLKK